MKNVVVFERSKKLYEEYLEFGGFPQVVLEESNDRKRQWLEDILNRILKKMLASHEKLYILIYHS